MQSLDRQLPTGSFYRPDLRLASAFFSVCLFRFCRPPVRICCTCRAQQFVLVTLSPVKSLHSPRTALVTHGREPRFHLCVRDFSRTAKLFLFFSPPPGRSAQRDLRQHRHTRTHARTRKPVDAQGHTRALAHTRTQTPRASIFCRPWPFSSFLI